MTYLGKNKHVVLIPPRTDAAAVAIAALVVAARTAVAVSAAEEEILLLLFTASAIPHTAAFKGTTPMTSIVIAVSPLPVLPSRTFSILEIRGECLAVRVVRLLLSSSTLTIALSSSSKVT